ncbi:F-box/FBD/LRR-repeat protein [Cardamine amara subsp. amara]|uniref:F-box/FBD/LRR-repeat protein n=1 Tax=Cardamine amara subsp. amara TaxID=228776 RepID=A0ABD1C3E8_CARAN
MVCDTICDLPDSLLTQILLNLPTKDSVKTSVLSTRWKNLWLSVPGLDIVTYDFPSEEVLVRFIDKFREFNHGSHMQNFKIVGYHHFDRVNELISTVVDCGVQLLDVSMYIGFRYYFMRQSIYKNKTLVSLKLVNVELKKPEFVVSLPCLKIMCLRTICYGKDGPLVVEKLISGSPLLEDLKLIKPFDIWNEKVVLFLRVRSQTLLRFAINRGDADFTVEIDAPRLEYLSLSNSQSDRIVVKNLSSLLMIDIHTKINLKYDSHLQLEDLRKHDLFYDFLTGISSVRHMIICEQTLKVLCCYSKVEPIPQFHNLHHLQAKFISSWSQLLPALLEWCPNLKILSLLGFCNSKEPWEIDFTNVPRCLISTLEYVEIQKWMLKDETEINLVNYFLENSAVLKKLTLSFGHPSITKQMLESYKKHITSTKLSSNIKLSLIDIRNR